MAKKRFGMNQSVNKALSQTIQMAEAENSNFINTEILIDRIKLDPTNPRNQKISIADLKDGLSNTDPYYKIKQEEYQNLEELASSIAKEGLLHPIVVYKDGDDYRLVAGERRFLASILANKIIIDARVFKKKPKNFDLKVVQWIENESRKDISLYNKLANIAAIVATYEEEHDEQLTAIKLSEIISTSRQSAQFYMVILGNKALMELIEEGRVVSLKLAIELSSLKDRAEIEHVLQTSLINKKKISPKNKAIDKSKTAGRKRLAVSFGVTKKPVVAKTIVQSVLSLDQFKKYSSRFDSTDWGCLDQSTKAFQKLIKLLEEELEATV